MPYGNFFGIRYHYNETKAGKGFWIFWYVLYVGLTIVCLVGGVTKFLQGMLPERQFDYDSLYLGLIGAAFFGSFWLIPLLISGIRRLTRPRANRLEVPADTGFAAVWSQDVTGQHSAHPAVRADFDSADSDPAAQASARRHAANIESRPGASGFAEAPRRGDAGSLADGPKAELEQLKEMLTAGLITQQDYDEKKKEILGRM